jgi:hypothetical protein
MCSPTLHATPVTYVVTLNPTTASTASINFPKFAPSIGQLNCVSLKDTISGISTTHVTNLAPDTVAYKFELDINNDIEGPGGLASTPGYSIFYYDTLAPIGQPGNNIINGPDSIFVNAADSNGTSNTGAYLGSSGDIAFTYTLNGGLQTKKGGFNYADTITTVYWGNFSLTYYWCPAVTLSTTITDFTAAPNGNSILLKWITNNQQANTHYEIQTSTDGQTFANIGEAEGNATATGASAKYQYQFNPDQANMGKFYVRIEETDVSGKVSYSEVLIVDPHGGSSSQGGPISYQTFPNPATNSLLFQFNNNLTGNFLVELISTSGQIVQHKAVTLTGASQIRLDLNPQPVSGLYFLRTTDLTHNQNYVSKVFIQ